MLIVSLCYGIIGYAIHVNTSQNTCITHELHALQRYSLHLWVHRQVWCDKILSITIVIKSYQLIINVFTESRISTSYQQLNSSSTTP